MDTIKVNGPVHGHEEAPVTVQPRASKKQKRRFSFLGEPFDLLVKAFIFITVFFLPLIFSPSSYDVLQLPKQAFLGVFVLLGLVFWLGKMFVTKNFTLKRTPLDVPILLFAAIYLIASLVSVSPVTSVLGFYGRLDTSFLTTLFFVIFYFLVTNNIKTKKQIMGLVLTLVMSGILVSIYALLQMFGVYLLSTGVTKAKTFNTIGTPNALAVFIMALIPITTALALRKENEARLSFAGTSVILFILLILINVKAAWWGLFAAGIVLVGLPMLEGLKKAERKWLLLPAVIGVMSLLFVFTSNFGLNLPKEIQLNGKEAITQMKKAVKERPVFGSGPETYAYDFSKFRSESLNNAENWSLRFDKSASEWLTNISTTGLVGTIATLLLLILGVVTGYVNYQRSKDEDMKYITLGATATVVAVAVMNLFYFNSFSLLLVFWLSLALIGIARKTTEAAEDDVQDFNLKSVSFEAKVFSGVFFVILFVASCYGLFFVSKSYAADIHYRKGLEKTQKVEDLPAAVDSLKKAVSYNPQRENYRLSLSRVYLVQANVENQKGEKEKDMKKIEGFLKGAIDQGKAAVDTNPASVSNWEGLIIVYRNAALYATGAIDWIEKSYAEALKLEPSNPVLVNGIGQVYLTKNDVVKASEQFAKALSLKTEFADPYFNIGLVYKEKKDYAKAIESLQKYLTYVPDSTEAKTEIENIKKLQAGGKPATTGNDLKGQPPTETTTSTTSE
jgi:putative inorganic carbon (HCO3(-)) transporter